MASPAAAAVESRMASPAAAAVESRMASEVERTRHQVAAAEVHQEVAAVGVHQEVAVAEVALRVEAEAAEVANPCLCEAIREGVVSATMTSTNHGRNISIESRVARIMLFDPRRRTHQWWGGYTLAIIKRCLLSAPRRAFATRGTYLEELR